ncbi:MAG: cell division protein FtsZ [Desulfobacterales bacterium]|nr:cell division protein FtsZ [Desulfobacterales bacterium]
MEKKAVSDYTFGEKIFRDYILKSYLGEGGFGKVFLVENRIGLPFALKVLHMDVHMEKRGVESVMRIRSNRLISIMDYGITVNGEDCVLMEYVQESLEEILEGGLIDEKKAVLYFTEILKGLKVLEENSIIHRDIKPENLFLLDDIIKIGDFGTAKYTSGESASMNRGIGTIHYTPPECFDNNYSFSGDRWSASVVLYRMLTGKFAFDGDNNRAIFGAILSKEPDLSVVPEKYHTFFKKCFEKDVEKRHGSVLEMLEHIEEIANRISPVEKVNKNNPPKKKVNEKRYVKISIIGVGCAGGNAINYMIDSDLDGFNFIAMNTALNALEISKAPVKIQLGAELAKGLGTGADLQLGLEAAHENAEAIRNALKDSYMVFIVAGFGGGTGSGATPVIAEICKELGVLTMAVITKPFSFEGERRARQAEEGIDLLKEIVDTVIIPNNRLRGLASKNATMTEMFSKADEVMTHTVKSITDLILTPGLINLNFNDIKTIMSESGMAFIGFGTANGENRATEAAERAISHPLLKGISITSAKGVLINITGPSILTNQELTEALERIHSEVGEHVEIMWGTVIDNSLGDEMGVTVILTGIGSDPDNNDFERLY